MQGHFLLRPLRQLPHRRAPLQCNKANKHGHDATTELIGEDEDEATGDRDALSGDGDDATCCDIANKGKAKTSL
jgi:hypothetical protein